MAPTTSDISLRIGGDGSSALEALAAVQAAIDALHGKTVDVNVRVDNANGAVTGLRNVGSEADNTARAHSRLSRESDRTSRAMRNLGDDSDRADRNMRRLGDSTNDANTGMRRAGDSSRQLSTGLSGVENNADSAAARLRTLHAITESVATAQLKALSATQAYDAAYAKAFSEAPGRSVRERTAHAELATSELRTAADEAQVAYRHSEQSARDMRSSMKEADRDSRQLGRTLRETGDTGAEAFLDLGGSSLRVGRGLGAIAGVLPNVATGALYATAGIGILSAGVAGLGVVSAGALGAAGVGLGMAAKGFTEFAVDSLKDTQGFKQSFENIGKAVQGYSAFISEPYGAALVGLADKAAAVAPAIVSPLRGASREIADLLEKGTPADATPGGDYLLEAAMRASQGALQVTRGVMPAFQAGLRALPALLEAAVPPATALASAIGVRVNQALREGVPAFGSLADAAGELGGKIAQIGAENFAPTLNAVSSLTRGLTGMADRMRPAIGPSIQAVTDLGNAVTGGLGDAAPAAVTKFSQAVSRNASGLQSLVSGLTRDAGMVGETVADVLGALGPAVDQGMITGGGPQVAAGIGTLLEGLAPSWMTSASNAVDRGISNILPNNQAGDWARNQLGLRDWGGQGAVAAGGGASLGGIPIAAGQDVGAPGKLPGQWSGSQSSWTVKGGTYQPLPLSEQARDVAGQPFPMGAGRIVGGELVQVNPHTGQPVADIKGMQEAQQYRDDLEAAQPGVKTAEKNRAEQMTKYESAGNAPGSYVYEGTGGKRPDNAAPPGFRPPPDLGPKGPGQGVGNAAGLQQLSQQLNQTGQTAINAGNQINQGMATARTGTTGTAPALQQQMSAAQQAVQQAGSVIPPAAQNAFSGINQAAQQVAPAPAIQPAMQTAVQEVDDGGAAMAASGSSAGANTVSAIGSGMTQEVTRTKTIVVKTVTQIVDWVADTFGIASPSKVFLGFGANTMQSLGTGIANYAHGPVNAVTQAAQGVVNAAQNSGVAQAFAGQVPGMNAGQMPGGNLPGSALQGDLSGYLGGRNDTDGRDYEQNYGNGEGWSLGKPGDRGAAQAAERSRQAQMARDSRINELTRAGLPQNEIEKSLIRDRRMQREQERAERRANNPFATDFKAYWTEKQDQRNEAHAAAKLRAQLGPDAAIPGDLQSQAQMWRARTGQGPPTSSPPAGTTDTGKVGADFWDVMRVGREVAAEGAERGSRYGSLIQQAGQLGKQAAVGIASGMVSGKGAVESAATAVANGLVDAAKGALGVKSPSTQGIYVGQQTAAGIGIGVASGTASALGPVGLIANNAGLAAGYEYVKSFNGAMDHVINRQALEAAARPQIDSDQAKAWLGAMGLFGPAGSGASIMKLPAVTIGGTAAQPIQNHITLKIDLDGQHFKDYTLEQIDSAFQQAADQYQGAFG